MPGYTIIVLKFMVNIIDVILFPINYLIYKPPWKCVSQNNLNHRLVISPDGSEIEFKSAQPEPTCLNKEAMVKEKIDTMSKLIDYMSKKYGNRPCLGQRKIIEQPKLNEVEGKNSQVLLDDR